MRNFIKYFYIIIFSVLNLNSYSYDLAMCAIFKNDAEWLEEWIEFHLRQGVQHFFLYNNNSSDNYMEILKKYIENGDVDLINWNFEHSSIYFWNKIQCDAYYDCITKNKDICKWIAVIDTDEFLFSPNKQSLTEILEDYSEYSGVCPNWITYGTSNCQKVSYKTLLKSLINRSDLTDPINLHVKSIVRPVNVIGCDNPHHFLYETGKYAVTENKEQIDGPFSKYVSCHKLRINHYIVRDLDYFERVKIRRWKEWGANVGDPYDKDKSLSLVYDPILVDR